MNPGKVLIIFDDGIAIHLDAADELWSRGLKGTFAIVTSLIDTPGFLESSELFGMAHNGHFICNHSAQHLWSGQGQPKQGREAHNRAGITADYLAGLKWSPGEPHDNIRMDYLCVPYGTSNVFGPEHLRELLGHFRWIRMTIGAPHPTDPAAWLGDGGKRVYPGDYRGRLIGVTAAGDSRYPNGVKQTLHDTAKIGGLAVILYHNVCSHDGSGMDVTWKRFQSDLDEMAKYVEAGELETVIPPDIR